MKLLKIVPLITMAAIIVGCVDQQPVTHEPHPTTTSVSAPAKAASPGKVRQREAHKEKAHITAMAVADYASGLSREQFNPDKRKWRGDPTRGASLLILMFATSIDALAAGFSLAMVGVKILYPALLIGVVAAGMTVLGLVFGKSFGLRFSRVAGVFGGLILIVLAVMEEEVLPEAEADI